MKESAFKTHFRAESIPAWMCPNCGSISLAPTDDSFNKNYRVPVSTSHPDFEPEWIEYVFSLQLKCSVESCSLRAVCIGTGRVSQEYLEHDPGEWGWFDLFEVKYFEPSLRLFIPPPATPHWVRHALDTSFSTYFSSPGTSLSTLRTALEVLLGELEVPSVDENGNFLSLAKRIRMLPDDYREVVEPANAIRWLGNDGTHSGVFVRNSDVLDGYRIFEHILRKLYPEQKASIESLVMRINEVKGVDRST